MEVINIDDKKSNFLDIGIEILSMGEIYNETKIIDCNFNITCTYDYNNEDIYDDKDLFIIENCIEEYSQELLCSCVTENRITKIWNYKCRINIYNKTENIPYNHGYFYLKLKLKKSYCNDNNNDFVIRDRTGNNNLFKSDAYYVISHNVDGQITYIWSWDLFNKEHVWKYMIIPTLLTIIQQLAHTVKIEGHGGWIGILSGFLLSDIALLFTIPETNNLILSEQIVYINFGFKIVLGLFAFYDLDVYFGEEIFPGLGHHNIDIIFVIITFITIVSWIFWILYNTFKYHYHINLILRYKEIICIRPIIWSKNFIKQNNVVNNNYNFKKFIKNFWSYCLSK